LSRHFDKIRLSPHLILTRICINKYNALRMLEQKKGICGGYHRHVVGSSPNSGACNVHFQEEICSKFCSFSSFGMVWFGLSMFI